MSHALLHSPQTTGEDCLECINQFVGWYLIMRFAWTNAHSHSYMCVVSLPVPSMSASACYRKPRSNLREKIVVMIAEHTDVTH